MTGTDLPKEAIREFDNLIRATMEELCYDLDRFAVGFDLEYEDVIGLTRSRCGDIQEVYEDWVRESNE